MYFAKSILVCDFTES